MEAKGQPFNVIGRMGLLEIPFFQRRYVWDEENWRCFLESLSNEGGSRFLGSIILKNQWHSSGEPSRAQVIDGQQRLTTFSIMLKALDDSFGNGQMMPYTETILFYNPDSFSNETRECRLKHSRLDKDLYETVMNKSRTDLSRIVGDLRKNEGGEGKLPPIVGCYDYFIKAFAAQPLDERQRLYNRLFSQEQVWVVIDLGAEDSEQEIFDTINTAGVRLTTADTIKNYLFQKYLEKVGSRETVCRNYDKYWDKVFSGDEECLQYWWEERKKGGKTPLEVFLQCFAIIKEIFDPENQNLLQIVDCYKAYINKLSDEKQILGFIRDLSDLAKVYREFFVDFQPNELLEWNKPCRRALHILRTCDTSTFDPLILNLIVESRSQETEDTAKLDGAMDELASYVLRHIVAGASVKNFYKECASIIKKRNTISKYLADKKESGEIGDAQVRKGLCFIKKSYNRIAGEILLWLEIKRRSEEGDAQFKGVPAFYGSDLEHIMPQTWEEYWPIDKPAVVDPESGDVVEDADKATQLRKDAVYEIGNMSLLNKGLNRRIKNREIQVKLNGDGARLSGIEIEKVDIRYTRDVLNQIKESGYVWNEKTIRDRTKKLTEEFLKIW